VISELAFDFILLVRRSRPLEGLAAFLKSKLVVLAKFIPMSAAQEINMLAFDHGAVSFVTNAVTLRSSAEKRRYYDDLQIDRCSRTFADARGSGNSWQ
jgi:hypothetical protein